MKRIEVKDMTTYLAALRTEVAKHGRANVHYKPDENTKVGFQSPDGWWLIPVVKMRESCANEVGPRKYNDRKVTAAGAYARRQSPEGVFVDWLSEKLQAAISDGERLHANHGLS